MSQRITPERTSESLQLENVARLRLSILRLARRIRQKADTGLTPSQLSAISTIERKAALRPSDLARHERVSKSTVTRLLAKLEAKGLVQRVSDLNDGRSAFVDITDKGRSLLMAFSEQADAFLAKQFDSLTEDERTRLVAAIPILEQLLDVKT